MDSSALPEPRLPLQQRTDMADDLENGTLGANDEYWTDRDSHRDSDRNSNRDSTRDSKPASKTSRRSSTVAGPPPPAPSQRTSTADGPIRKPYERHERPPPLDVDNPGPWLTWYHRYALIIEIKPPMTTVLSQMKDAALACGDAVAARYARVTGAERRRARPQAVADTPRRIRISIAELQRIHLRKLQIQLARDAVEMRYNLDEPEGWEAHLRDYTQAMRDYDYMSECSRRQPDPFLISGERWIDNLVLRRALANKSDPSFTSYAFERYYSIDRWRGADDNSSIGGIRSENNATARARRLRRRLGIAGIAGAFLLAPMWLMVLRQTRYTALVSTTVCVAVFGVAMSFYLEEEKDVLSSTAAYAAVLVVFVGLNTQ